MDENYKETIEICQGMNEKYKMIWIWNDQGFRFDHLEQKVIRDFVPLQQGWQLTYKEYEVSIWGK